MRSVVIDVDANDIELVVGNEERQWARFA
jgi:hypothetical protein